MKLVGLSAFLIAITSATAADDFFDSEYYYIRGDMKCTEFVEIWNGDDEKTEQYLHWFNGFISGHSYSNTLTQKYLSNDKLIRPKMLGQELNTSCLMANVVSYCEEHPDRYMSQGVHRLMIHLKDQSHYIYNPQMDCKLRD